MKNTERQLKIAKDYLKSLIKETPELNLVGSKELVVERCKLALALMEVEDRSYEIYKKPKNSSIHQEVYVLEYEYSDTDYCVLAVSLDENKLKEIVDSICECNKKVLEMEDKLYKSTGNTSELKRKLVNLKLNHPLIKYGFDYSARNWSNLFVNAIESNLFINSYKLI